ncbi:hypothetical protein GKZ68_00190 [Hymenobacter sp. BRD128]|uniref:hypothetical protein n=1 Tax=Hymenobacter sp. BRD128 TaxID=2675878 RepID=UPI00156377CE|nr:hypothetical protein [Hymenobacter sp. BRD128]QKG55193.1 hypothetical protein GKZ68_00190 [Hymenobacter sp. BRD128]
MKTLWLLLVSGLLLAPGPANGQPAAPAGPRPVGTGYPLDLLVITHVNLIDPSTAEVVRDCMVVVRDGLIVSVGKWVPAGRAVPRLNGQGLYLVPGLWDGRANALATAAAERVALPLYLASGITSIREMPSQRPPGEVTATSQLVTSGACAGPRLMLAGPLLAGPLASAGTRAEGRAQATARLAGAGGQRPLVGALLPREAYLGVAAAVAAAQLPLGATCPRA